MMSNPWHPVAVHFTIALFVVSVIFDFLGLILKKKQFYVAAWYNLFLAGIACLLTILPGLIEEAQITVNAAAVDTFNTHKTLAFFISVVIFVLLFWRISLKGQSPLKFKFFYFIISLLGIILLMIGSYQGGKLVYQYGTGVRVKPPSLIEKKNLKKEKPPHLSDDFFYKKETPGN